ncbi:MAG: 2-oxoacid ferredoxin oxidoreductase, partial [Halanaerobiales bacterium]|nr:2-oxoacid ferredoxin oxidoreductase [Bacillota bacterium]
GDDYDPTDYMAAMEKANEWGHRIPIGIIYKEEKKTFRERLALTDQEGLVGKAFNPADYAFLLDEFR